MENPTLSAHTLNHALRAAVADLEHVNPWVGMCRFVSIGSLFLCLVWLAWSSSNWLSFLFYTAIAGIFYSFWLVCTHDATHYTLTGWKRFDEWMPRLLSYPMMWPYGTYAQLHHLHHAWNGIDLRDPERVQWTKAEYEQASPLYQWYMRHQWPIDIFVLGGLGLIVKTVHHGLRLRRQYPRLSHALIQDGAGILITQTSFAIAALFHHHLVHYLLFWLVLERVIGLLLQARDHLEHYGLWQTTKGHQLTQLYACRNLTTFGWVAWLMGGLNNHAVHHAFPTLPFNHLSEAFERTQAVLAEHGLPQMARDGGYIQETIRLSMRSLLIDEERSPMTMEP